MNPISRVYKVKQLGTCTEIILVTNVENMVQWWHNGCCCWTKLYKDEKKRCCQRIWKSIFLLFSAEIDGQMKTAVEAQVNEWKKPLCKFVFISSVHRSITSNQFNKIIIFWKYFPFGNNKVLLQTTLLWIQFHLENLHFVPAVNFGWCFSMKTKQMKVFAFQLNTSGNLVVGFTK